MLVGVRTTVWENQDQIISKTPLSPVILWSLTCWGGGGGACLQSRWLPSDGSVEPSLSPWSGQVRPSLSPGEARTWAPGSLVSLSTEQLLHREKSRGFNDMSLGMASDRR